MKKAGFFLMIAALAALLSGCAVAAAESNPAAATGRLNISAEQDENSSFCWSEDELGGNAPEIAVDGLANLTITLDDNEYPLDEAIRTGRIAGEEIAAFAQIDARAGICAEKAMTENGLTWYRYRYPAFDLYVCNDVLQTPKHGDYRVQ